MQSDSKLMPVENSLIAISPEAELNLNLSSVFHQSVK